MPRNNGTITLQSLLGAVRNIRLPHSMLSTQQLQQGLQQNAPSVRETTPREITPAVLHRAFSTATPSDIMPTLDPLHSSPSPTPMQSPSPAQPSPIATIDQNTQQIQRYFQTLAVWQNYNPTWNGTLGNGTLVGRWASAGKTALFYVTLTYGSTTTHPFSVWTITLPLVSSPIINQSCNFSYASTTNSAWSGGWGQITTNSQTVANTYMANAPSSGATSPYGELILPGANQDIYTWWGLYETG